jgi:hypothetical protein
MDKQITIKKYLSEEAEKIHQICDNAIQNNQRIHFKAPVGSGKTTTIIEIVERHPEKNFVILFPQISITEQVHTKLNTIGIESVIINSYTIDKAIEKNKDIVKDRVFLTTIDSTHKLVNGVELNNKETVVILDETHTYIQSPRENHTRSVDTICDARLPIIGFSATPSAWVNKMLFEIEDQVQIKYKKAQPKKVNQTTIEQGQLKTVSEIVAKRKDQLVVIFTENKTHQYKIESHLKEYDATIKVSCLNLDTRKKEEEDCWKHLMKEDELPKGVNVYILNSVVQSGINILNKDIDRVYMVGSFDPFGFAQYLGRCRNYAQDYEYYSTPCYKQLNLFGADEIQESVDITQNILKAASTKKVDRIKGVISLISDRIYEGNGDELKPNKCMIAYKLYEGLRGLSSTTLTNVVEQMFDDIEFEHQETLGGNVVTSKISHKNIRTKAKKELIELIKKHCSLIITTESYMNFDYSHDNLQKVIDTNFIKVEPSRLTRQAKILTKIARELEDAQVTPKRMFIAASMYQMSHRNEQVLEEFMRLHNNQIRDIGEAKEFFGKTNSTEIRALLKNINQQINRSLLAGEWRETIKEEINTDISTDQLEQKVYKFCLQTKRTNGRMKLIKTNESMDDYLESFNFKHLEYQNGKLMPR